PQEAERDLMRRSADTLEQVSGVRPVGLRTPSWDFSQHTLEIEKEMGLLYDSSLMSDEDCYELLLDGEPTGVIELPVECVRDEAQQTRLRRLDPHTRLRDGCLQWQPLRPQPGGPHPEAVGNPGPPPRRRDRRALSRRL